MPLFGLFVLRVVTGLGRCVVVHDDAVRRAFEVVELTAFDGPQHDPGDDADEDEAQRDEQQQDIHSQRFVARAGRVSTEAVLLFCLNSDSRSAFSTTSSELDDMPMPAIHGVT